MSVKKIMTIPIRVKNKKISMNRNYNSFPKFDKMLRSEKGFFAHVIKSDLMIVQIRNTFSRPYMISKNFRVNHLRDFDEEECFLTTSKNRHLAITSTNRINVRKKLKNSNEPKKKSMKQCFRTKSQYMKISKRREK